ncbi:unnamed protein product [Rotaria sordida]|uniref:Uncharacterized protein n=1 Tax=Rotaria sordida TaxID=392033 RepID=A0A814D5D3_9BILA|nr:unnamed protein product [Rotaria sordida]
MQIFIWDKSLIKQAMKQSMISIFFIVLIFIAWTSMLTDARQCWGSGYGGCNDSGCNAAGGYCRNFGRPPNNDCRCVGKTRGSSSRRRNRPHG